MIYNIRIYMQNLIIHVCFRPQLNLFVRIFLLCFLKLNFVFDNSFAFYNQNKLLFSLYLNFSILFDVCVCCKPCCCEFMMLCTQVRIPSRSDKLLDRVPIKTTPSVSDDYPQCSSQRGIDKVYK